RRPGHGEDDRGREGPQHHPQRRRLPDRRGRLRARALPLPVHERPGRRRRANHARHVTGWLGKSEVNARYYATVAGDIAFETEASLGYHPGAVARLILAHAASLGKQGVRILEIGASSCLFARALLAELRMLGATEWPELWRIDYLAVDLSRSALE